MCSILSFVPSLVTLVFTHITQSITVAGKYYSLMPLMPLVDLMETMESNAGLNIIMNHLKERFIKKGKNLANVSLGR